MTRFKVKDLTSGFRLLSRLDAVRFIDLLPNTFSYPTTYDTGVLTLGTYGHVCPHSNPVPCGTKQNKLGYRRRPVLADHHKDRHAVFSVPCIFAGEPFLFFCGIANYAYTFVTQHRFTNMSVFLLTTAVIIFMLGLISEQIALLRMERQSARQPLHERDE